MSAALVAFFSLTFILMVLASGFARMTESFELKSLMSAFSELMINLKVFFLSCD